ncbi:hypothetical protein ACM66B_001313 [Microbotryomycetes sp. NB124-2]
MSKTTDTSNLFQSDAQHERAELRRQKQQAHANTAHPITLKSKPLRLSVRQRVGLEADAWVAQSGFTIRKIGLETGSTKQLYKGHLGPVTAIDFYTPHTQTSTRSSQTHKRQPTTELLVSGSWDKSVRVWDTRTRKLLSTTVGHVDFVKAVLVISALRIAISGSSDRDLRIWDLSRFDDQSWQQDSSSTSDKDDAELEEPDAPAAEPQIGAAPPAAVSNSPLDLLAVLKGHSRPIERLASYPLTKQSAPSAGDSDSEPEPNGRFALFSADSMGALKTWELWRDEQDKLHAELRSEVRDHEIGIYDIVVGDGEIWTASADTSALLSSFDFSSPSTPPKPLVRLPMSNGIKSILPMSLAIPSLNSSHVLLGGSTDEQIHIVDMSVPELDPVSSRLTALPPWPASSVTVASSDKHNLAGLVSSVQGHAHEVTDLHAFLGPKDLASDDNVGAKEAMVKRDTVWILSASVDGTLRRWKWSDMLAGTIDKPPTDEVVVGDKDKPSLLTAEEEAELEALMNDD